MARHIFGEEIIRLPSISAWKDPASLDEWTLPRLEHFVSQVESTSAHRLPAHIRYAYERGTEDRKQSYREEKREFEEGLLLLSPSEAKKTRDTLEALRFVDWEHTAKNLMTSFLSHGRKPLTAHDLELRYNPNNDPGESTFKNIQAANRFLAETKAKPSLTRLLKVHSITMSGSVDGISSQHVGKVRTLEVIGDETSTGITVEQLKNIERNPYLSFASTDRPRGAKLDRVYGSIVYPTPAAIKEVALSRIERTHKAIFRDVTRYQALSLTEQRRVSAESLESLIEGLVTALSEERYKIYNSKLEELEPLNDGAKVLRLIRTCAQHCRDIMSIHPLVDGNGRTVRQEALYDPLNKRGISRPRLRDPNGDILQSASSWQDDVLRGVVATDALYRDVTLRIKMGLPIENSPEIIFPKLPRDVGTHEVQHRRKAVTHNRLTMPLDPAQFSAYIEARFSEDARLMRQFTKDPLSVMEELRDDYKRFSKETQRLLRHTKNGLTVVRLMFVDADFAMTFGENFAADKERWDYKLSRWYTPDLVWRGLSDRERTLSDDEIVRMFTAPTAHTVSQNMLEHDGLNARAPQVLAKIRAEFTRYNSDLVSGEIAKVALDHIKGEGLYHSSYCLSTSLRLSIAKEFARGKLALGTGPNDYKDLQHELKDRLVIGAFRAYKDVDSMTLRRVAPAFKHPPNRQAEVLAIGGIDPDAVMCVYRLDAHGDIAASWIRNPEAPTQVLLFDHEISISNLNDIKKVIPYAEKIFKL